MSNPLFQFANLSRFNDISHGINHRSSEEKNNFNMSFDFGDRSDVLANRARMMELVGGELQNLISSYQTHGDHVYVYRTGEPIPNDEIEDFDAFVSDAVGVGFMVKVADCQPILLYEPVRSVVGLVHSGWKGSLKNIVGKTVRSMQSEFGAKPGDIMVGIGPSLGPCCAEFSNPEEELNEEALHYLQPGNRVDFWALTKAQLQSEGVLLQNIETAEICTVCEKDRWFSYRGCDGDEGRFGAILGLRRRSSTSM
ncbi:MAG: polyphenol oxidase family protein [Candidatus Peregrinibacteria bacterium]|nr:polyphenol oxidase family protein [Candidatus Peregrinibacteria bacterium]